MIEFNLLQREFRFSWPVLLGYFMLTTLLCSLGFWQLGREEQKRALLEVQNQAMQAPALDLNARTLIDRGTYRYRQASLNGHYDAVHQILIDNQILDGKPGYLVLTPFVPDSGQTAVLVNRGWLPLGASRQTLPDLSINSPVKQIQGRINHLPEPGIRLDGADVPGETWPVRIQVVDTQRIAAKLGYAVADYQIELNPDQAEGYQRQWSFAVAIPPEKHRAYAVQWFGLALTLTALFIWNSSRKKYRG